jgi:hypothetical protein
LLALLPPVDHLATFQWIVQGSTGSDDVTRDYFLARLTEATGNLAEAARLYRAQQGKNTSFDARIAEGLARCEPAR